MNIKKMQRLYFGLYESMKHKMISTHVRQTAKKNTQNPDILTADERKQAIDFYAPYSKIDPQFHAFFKEKTGVFHPEFLPVDLYINRIDEYFNDRNAALVLDNKCLYPRLFPNIPQADTILFRMGGLWYDEKWELLSGGSILQIIEKEPALFVKAAADSAGGDGVLFIGTENGSMTEQFEDAMKRLHGDVVVQRPVKQHHSLAKLNESSVNTLRILSLLTDGNVKIYSSFVRMGINNAKIDNACAGGIFCGIRDDGTLKPRAYKLNGDSFEAHPTNGMVFDGYRIEGFDKAKELVVKLATQIPVFRMVSWDIIIDEQGEPLMLEANFSKGGLGANQLANGPLFGEDTEKVLREVFGKA